MLGLSCVDYFHLEGIWSELLRFFVVLDKFQEIIA